MPAADYDRRYVEAVLPDLQDYLLAAEIYWPIHGSARKDEPPFPQFTLGNLLIALQRLKAHRLPAAQTAEIERLHAQVDAVRGHWRVAWEKKAGREYSARLRLWRDYLEELREQPHQHADRFAYEVGRRATLVLLEGEAGKIEPAEVELLSGLDGLLRSLFVPGDFVWEEDLRAGFPAGVYWFLYGSIQIQST